MKKLSILFASVLFITGIAFSQTEDDVELGAVNEEGGITVQLNLGYASDTTTAKTVCDSFEAKQLILELDAFSMYKPIDLLGIGYNLNLNCGIGGSEKLNTEMETPWGIKRATDGGLTYSIAMEIGPAVGLFLGNIANIYANLDFAFGYKHDTPYKYHSEDNKDKYELGVGALYVGFSTGVQAVLLPKMGLNPVFGWRFRAGYSSDVDLKVSCTDTAWDFNDKYKCTYTFRQNIIYAGLAINF
ncbi:MAG: hypothetical protein J6X84_01860 [Treponema sp.]|nr:hypothetical protein [Treponema sp.]